MSSKVSKKRKSSEGKPEHRSELSERNEKLKKELEAMPVQRTVMDAFTKWRLATYAWVVFLPPYGLYRIWSKESTFVRSEKVVWTFMIIVYMLRFLWLILFS